MMEITEKREEGKGKEYSILHLHPSSIIPFLLFVLSSSLRVSVVSRSTVGGEV
jgi:hypothetical protein